MIHEDEPTPSHLSPHSHLVSHRGHHSPSELFPPPHSPPCARAALLRPQELRVRFRRACDLQRAAADSPAANGAPAAAARRALKEVLRMAEAAGDAGLVCRAGLRLAVLHR